MLSVNIFPVKFPIEVHLSISKVALYSNLFNTLLGYVHA